MFWTKVASGLARLGGGDLKLLARVPMAKGRFVQMGLVLISTASLAVLSMAFALTDALDAAWWLAVPAALGWGFIILNIDRMLIQNIRAVNGFWRTAAVLLPRLLIAALLGAVIATPLVLRVFEAEIVTNMRENNATAANELGVTRAESPDAKRLKEVEASIAVNEGILAGNLPNNTSPNVTAAEKQLQDAEDALAPKRVAAADAYDKMVCELNGSKCRGASGNKGPGPRYQALKRLFNIAEDDLNVAQNAVEKARKALDAANAEAAAANRSKLAEAQAQARAELPGLYTEQKELQAAIAAVRAGDSATQAKNTGMLARIEALERLGAESAAANRAHWAVALLLFLIELLPVLVKLMTTMGPPSLYDRVHEFEESSTFDAATHQRNNERRRIEGESKKQREIEEDMRKRETSLGFKANAHVATEMEKILDVALQQWSAQVTTTLQAAEPPVHGTARPAVNGTKPAPVNGSVNGSVSAVNATYGLPQSGTL